MDTQNTPIHVNLWHHEFWLMSLANILLTICVYVQIPSLPEEMLREGFTFTEIAISLGAYGLGIFTFGGFTNYLVQRFRRNMVFVISVVGMIACLSFIYYSYDIPRSDINFGVIVFLRFLLGAFFGLSQMVLCSTLIIDSSESFKRTQANHATAWFARFALSIGPALSFFICQKSFFIMTIVAAIACAVAAICLIQMVHFPFKAPGENLTLFSTDRFFLTQGFPLFMNLVTITAIMGMLLSIKDINHYCGLLMIGFIVAIAAEKWVFQNADLKSEVITGLICIGIAILLLLTRQHDSVTYIVCSLIGFGIGIIGSRFLLFFIKLAKHCQRGTSQSTFFLGWEFGISLGLFIGYMLHDKFNILVTCFALTIVSLLLYHFFIHSWYIKNRNR